MALPEKEFKSKPFSEPVKNLLSIEVRKDLLHRQSSGFPSQMRGGESFFTSKEGLCKFVLKLANCVGRGFNWVYHSCWSLFPLSSGCGISHWEQFQDCPDYVSLTARVSEALWFSTSLKSQILRLFS